MAWLALVVAEQLDANAGLGFIVSQATQFLQNNVISWYCSSTACLGLLTDALVRLLERRTLAWRRLPGEYKGRRPSAREPVRGWRRGAGPRPHSLRFEGRRVLDGVDL